MRIIVTFLAVLVFFNLALSENTKKINEQLNASKVPVRAVPRSYYLMDDPAKAGNTQVEKIENINKSAKILKSRESEYGYHVLIDSSRNGYGWLNTSIRSVDRFVGTDAFGSQSDFVLAGYRQYNLSNPNSGIIGATTINVSEGLASGAQFRHEQLNQDLKPGSDDPDGTVGGRYPGAVALDRPFVTFNQYIEGDATTTPALSHPYVVADYGSYGDFGGAWAPSAQMDAGYEHHDSPGGNRLWNGSTDIVKDDEGVYHYVGVYANWYLGSAQGELDDNDHAIITATNSDIYSDWVINTSPELIDPQQFTFVSPAVDINKNGFGVIAATGHEGYHEGTSYFFEELRIVLQTTNDYGQTWSEPREVSWAELGIPTEITAEDSLFYLTIDE
ncbi:MAG: hypothetical protein GF313_09120, partial [Caldithrix sp.]|nr:hypothetical protein [Caldithrix sp.]